MGMVRTRSGERATGRSTPHSIRPAQERRSTGHRRQNEKTHTASALEKGGQPGAVDQGRSLVNISWNVWYRRPKTMPARMHRFECPS